MAQQFGGTITITDRTTLAAALAAAGFTGGHALKYLELRTSDTVAVYMTEDGFNEPGTKQVMTATVVSPAGITGDGNGDSVLTAAGMTGSPITVVVPLTIADHDTEELIAEAFYDEYVADSDITDFFNVTLDGNAISFERVISAVDDATMEVTIEDDTSAGITDDVSATQTTAGALNAGILIDDKPLELGDGSHFVVDSGLTWLIPTGTANIQVYARD